MRRTVLIENEDRTAWEEDADGSLAERLENAEEIIKEWYSRNMHLPCPPDEGAWRTPALSIDMDAVMQTRIVRRVCDPDDHYWFQYLTDPRRHPRRIVILPEVNHFRPRSLLARDQQRFPADALGEQTFEELVPDPNIPEIRAAQSRLHAIYVHEGTPDGTWRQAGPALAEAVKRAVSLLAIDPVSYTDRLEHIVTYFYRPNQSVQIFRDPSGALWAAYLARGHGIPPRIHRIYLMPANTGRQSVEFNISN